MEVQFTHQPAYTVAVARLAPGEQLYAEGGAMLSMTTGTQIQTQARGGVLKALGRKMLAGESFFMNTFTAPPSGGEMLLAPSLPGDMMLVELQNDAWLLHRDGFVAAEMSVAIETKWGGAKTFFGGEGPFIMRVSGQGKVIMATYGAIQPIDLQAGQQYTVDSGHMVAWPETMAFEVHKVGGVKSLFLSGEGFVVTLTGPGRAYMQTRSEDSLLSWLIPRLPSSGS